MKSIITKLKCWLGMHDWWYLEWDGSLKEDEYYYCIKCDKRKK